MQPIRFTLYSLRRRRPAVAFEAGRGIGIEELPHILDGNERLVAAVLRLAQEMEREHPGAPIPLHVPLLNGREPAPSLEDAVVQRKGQEIYVLAIATPAALAGYHLALACLLRAEHGVELPGSCWLDAPPESSKRYKPVYRHISRSVQTALREHLPALWFSYPNGYDAVPIGQAMLMYQASPSAAGQTRGTICRDLLSPASLNGIFYVTRWTLPALLAEVHAELRAQQNPRAHQYRPSLAPEIIERQRKLGSPGRTILLVEQEVVHAFCNAGVRMGEVMANGKFTQGRRRTAICHAAEDLISSVSLSLGRFARMKDRAGLALTLIDAGTRALERALAAEEEDTPYAA